MKSLGEIWCDLWEFVDDVTGMDPYDVALAELSRDALSGLYDSGGFERPKFVHSPLKGENPPLEHEMFEAIIKADFERFCAVLAAKPDVNAILYVDGKNAPGSDFSFSAIHVVIIGQGFGRDVAKQVEFLNLLAEHGADFSAGQEAGLDLCTPAEYAKFTACSRSVRQTIDRLAAGQKSRGLKVAPPRPGGSF